MAQVKATERKTLSLIQKLSQSIQLVEELAQCPDYLLGADLYVRRLRHLRDLVSSEAPLPLLLAADRAGWTDN